MRFYGLLAALFIPFFGARSAEPELTSKQLSYTSYELAIHVPVSSGDALYADYLRFSVDHPDISLSEWHASVEPIVKYDTRFKQTKKVFEKPFQITMQANLLKPEIEDAKLHISTYSRTQQINTHHKFALAFGRPHDIANTTIEKTAVTAQQKKPASSAGSTHSQPSFQAKIAALFTETDSWGVRLILALLLGLLLSLTPCIYPMIPITVGILQSQGSKSVGRNFLISLTYILGIATTFALFGTAAAFSGKMFGSFMKNPFVVLGIVALLMYLAGSMLGFYEMYTPRFLQGSNPNRKNGSFISIFLFGAASGTVASPCLSPGLILLLTMVTAVGSIPLGFVLLFFFGIGLGLPLLAIGTFSGSLNMLPRAGTWMIDIKQFFGFILLATCFYFLATIVPIYIIAWASALFSFGVGIFYFIGAKKASSFTNRMAKNSIGILCIALSVYLSYEAYKQTDIHMHGSQKTIWLRDYNMALAQAKREHKKMIIDISAPYCSICKAIDTKIFADAGVQEKMKKYITIKIDDIEADEITMNVQKRFAIIGAPTILVYDPENDTEIKRWGGDLYDQTPEQFIEEIG